MFTVRRVLAQPGPATCAPRRLGPFSSNLVSAPAAKWSIVEYRGRAGLLELEADWRRLSAAMPLRTSFHAFEANLAYLDCVMPEPDRFKCLALSDGTHVRAICPLEPNTDRTLGLPIPVWKVPQHPHCRLGDIICPEDEARRELIPALVGHLRRSSRGPQLLFLGPLEEDSLVWDGLRYLDCRDFCVDLAKPVHVLDCTQPFEVLMSGLSRNFRGNLRKARKKLEALADVRFVTATPGADFGAEFEAFLSVEASGWKGARGTRTALRFRDRHADFFLSLSSMLGRDDRCEINALYVGGSCVASQFCTRTGADYSILKIGYDENHARVSPGQLLIARTLRTCCEDPDIERLNLVSDADWHVKWRADSIAMRQVHIAISRWSGRPLIALLRLRLGYARRLVRWLRCARDRLVARGNADRKAISRAGRQGHNGTRT